MNRASYHFEEIASTGSQYQGFGPYVAALGVGGQVAFQASGRDGSSRLLVDGRIGSADEHELISHPVIGDNEVCAYYARLAGGEQALCYFDGERWYEECCEAGPLGPTINAHGSVALRGRYNNHEAIFLWKQGRAHLVADTATALDSFDGLPLVSPSDEVVFRAERLGVAGLYRWQEGEISELVGASAAFTELGRFACLGSDGRVAFCARDAAGDAGIYVIEGHKEARCVWRAGRAFAEVRGVLLADTHLLFYARETQAALAIYRYQGATLERVLGIGDSYGDSRITAFALNPVSIHRAGQLVLRFELADQRELIVRADPN